MTINRHNYESYLLDYAEGNLSKELIPEMEKFLLQNPDIQEELELFSEALVEEPAMEFPDKKQLKQIPLEKSDAQSEDFQRFCVAYIEGWMTQKEQEVFEKTVAADQEKAKELQFFRSTLLSAPSVVFDEKLLLKHDETNPKVDKDNFESYCVGCVEGWLNQTQLVALNDYIAQDESRKRVLELYQKTRLVPDVSIFYPDKHKIKRFSILHGRTRRYLSYVASAAAVIVFGLMVYYSGTLDDTKQLAGNLNQVELQETQENQNHLQKADELSIVSKEEESKSDLFGFNKLHQAGKKAQEIEKQNRDALINPIKPIAVASIACEPCKKVFDADPSIHQPQEKRETNRESTYISDEVVIEENEKTSSQNFLKAVADAGLSGVNKLTNGKLVIHKSKNEQKTKIALNTRYFAFSTQVNKRNK